MATRTGSAVGMDISQRGPIDNIRWLGGFLLYRKDPGWLAWGAEKDQPG